MNKSDFSENVRYTITYKDAEGKLRPLGIYVMRLLEEAMIVRMTQKEGVLRKLAYTDVVKIVKSQAVAKKDRYYVPDALLSEQHWADRTEIPHYSSAPNMGK